MAFGQSYTVVVFVLIFGQMISITAADYDDGSMTYGDDGPCSDFSTSDLGDGCSISDDCSTITCDMNFGDQQITFKLKVNKCETPISVTASMTVPDLGISWSHTYTSDDIIQVPRFTVSVPGIVSAGVYVQVGLSDQGSTINMKVKLLAGVQAFEKTSYPLKVTVIDADLPISTDDCGFFGWWNDLSDAAKAAVIGGPILLIIVLIGICCCCCACCHGCRRSSPRREGRVMVQPITPAVVATNAKSTVKMRPLVEEA